MSNCNGLFEFWPKPRDIGPVTSKTNVTGSIQDANGITKYAAAQLASADPTEHQFVSAIWDIFTLEETAAVVSFGTDNGLQHECGLGQRDRSGIAERESVRGFLLREITNASLELALPSPLGWQVFLCHEFARGVRHESSRV
jgi:hypothetical protein